MEKIAPNDCRCASCTCRGRRCSLACVTWRTACVHRFTDSFTTCPWVVTRICLVSFVCVLSNSTTVCSLHKAHTGQTTILLRRQVQKAKTGYTKRSDKLQLIACYRCNRICRRLLGVRAGGMFVRGDFCPGGLCPFSQVQCVYAPSRLSVPTIVAWRRNKQKNKKTNSAP